MDSWDGVLTVVWCQCCVLVRKSQRRVLEVQALGRPRKLSSHAMLSSPLHLLPLTPQLETSQEHSFRGGPERCCGVGRHNHGDRRLRPLPGVHQHERPGIYPRTNHQVSIPAE